MCIWQLMSSMALPVPVMSQVCVSAGGRLFRPWDGAAVEQATSGEHQLAPSTSHRNKRTIQEPTRTLPASSPVEAEECTPRAEAAGAGATTTSTPGAAVDALYAELTRADLARLGLVCPADVARLRARKQRPKKYHCPHCHVAFSNNGQLRGHIRIHTGERPFACPHSGCGKAFTRNEELTRHRRIHSGVRPYPCVTCGKRFGRKDHLKKHARTHQKLALPPHPSHPASQAAAAAAAAAAAFNMAGLFPLDPALLPALMPYSYPGIFGF